MTLPPTRSPGAYRRCGSSGSIWKSARFRVRDFNGAVSLENRERPVDAVGDD